MRRQAGLTLVEGLVVLAVGSTLVALLLMVYVQGTGRYSHLQAQSLTERVVENAFREIEDACWRAMYAEVKNGKLFFTYPRDFDAYGNPIPHNEGGRVRYRRGERFVYYLSDATGNPNRSGTILWRGIVAPNGAILPDRERSLYSNGRGRITPLVEFVPSVWVHSSGITVRVIARSQIQVRGDRYETRRQRSFMVRNANTWR